MSNSIHRGRLLAAACAGMSTFGFSLVLLGTLFGFPEVRARLHVDDLRQGGMSSLLILGMIASTMIVGPLIDRFGTKLVLATSSFLVSTTFLAFAYVESFALAAVIAVLLGVGGGGLNTATNVVVSEIYAEKRGAMLNVLAIFFGAGAVLVPFLAASVSPKTAVLSAAVCATLCGLLYLVMDFPPGKEAHAFKVREAAKVVTYPGVLLFATLLFFQSANEQVTHTFASRWVGNTGASPRLATFALMGYMIAMAVGRLSAVQLLKKIPKHRLVIANAVLAFVGAVILFVSRAPLGAAAGVVVTGLGFSAIYPTVLAIAGDRYQRFAGTLFGTLFSLALVGSFISPSLAGFVGERTSTQFATVVPLAGTAVVVLLALLLRRHATAVQEGKKSAAIAD